MRIRNTAPVDEHCETVLSENIWPVDAEAVVWQTIQQQFLDVPYAGQFDILPVDHDEWAYRVFLVFRGGGNMAGHGLDPVSRFARRNDRHCCRDD